MNSKKYIPEPIDTSSVVLPDDIIRLAEIEANIMCMRFILDNLIENFF